MSYIWDMWGDLSEQDYFEYEDDFGVDQNIYSSEYLYGTPTEFSVGPDQYDDDTMEYVAADRYTFMAADDEGEFYDPNEPNVYPPGTSVVNLEDFRSGSGDFDDVTNYGNQLAKLASVLGQATKAADPIFGGKRDKRALSRFDKAQPGSIPGGVGLSGARATETNAEMINRRNIEQLFGPAGRTGIDANYRLLNIPQARPVSIPTGTIGTTSRKRSIYGK